MSASCVAPQLPCPPRLLFPRPDDNRPPHPLARSYVFPKGSAEWRGRVAAALGLLLGSKLLNVQARCRAPAVCA